MSSKYGTQGTARGENMVQAAHKSSGSPVRALAFARASLPFASVVSAETLTGIAHWRERIALPAGSVFEAVIQDIAPATVLARTEITDPGQPPVTFAIA
jgi:uncharacterized lipoprotein YbaY